MKTPVTHDQMIAMFSTQQTAILQYQQDMTKAINAKTIAETDRVSKKMDDMIDRQDKQNGNVANNVREIAMNTTTTKKVKGWMNHWRWCLAGLFVFCYGTAWIYENINVKELIVNIIGKL